MRRERWQQIDRLLEAALERDPAEREAFLDQACGSDEALRKEVESLIGYDEQAQSFIERPAVEMAAQMIAGDQARLAAGRKIAHYEIISMLGADGMGEVYLAHDTRLGRKVALKLLPDHFTKEADRLRRFEQEARAASALNHPNIITIHDIGQADQTHYIVTEHIDGQTLRGRMTAARLKPGE
ncbi:MAG TPA: protein kinase, partial [Blastocatellia bacterium]|nr:protein kinase [Blastocatellia bacterium]